MNNNTIKKAFQTPQFANSAHEFPEIPAPSAKENPSNTNFSENKSLSIFQDLASCLVNDNTDIPVQKAEPKQKNRFKMIWKSKSLKSFKKNFRNWITRRNEITPDNIPLRSMQPENLSEWLGNDRFDSLGMLARTVPGVGVNGVCAVLGALLMGKKGKFSGVSKVLGGALFSHAFISHFTSCAHPWSVAFMSNEQIKTNAANGHYFARFASKIGRLTGASPSSVALSSAFIYSSIVPALGIGTIIGVHLFRKAKEGEIIPDEIALGSWLQNGNKDEIETFLKDFISKYPHKERFLEVAAGDLSYPDAKDQLRLECRRMLMYAIEKAPAKALKKEKKSILKKVRKYYKKRPLKDRVWSTMVQLNGIIGTITAITTDILRIFGTTIAPILAPVATVLSYTFPIFGAITVITTAVGVIKDFRSPTATKKTKLIAIAQLVVALSSVILTTISIFVPAAAPVLLAIALLSTFAAIGLTCAKIKIHHDQHLLKQSIEQNKWNKMHDMLTIYCQDKDYPDKIKQIDSKERKKYRGLNSWIKLQRKAYRKGVLKPAQVRTLIADGVLERKLTYKERQTRKRNFFRNLGLFKVLYQSARIK